jgi:tetratricopeptide (TPR) repeat protein
MAKNKKLAKGKPPVGNEGVSTAQMQLGQNSKPGWQKAAMMIIMAIVIFAAFSPALNNLMVNMDDNGNVYQNPVIKSLSAQNLKAIFNPATNTVGNYIPLTNISLAIDYHLYGLTKTNPNQSLDLANYTGTGYHSTAILLHIINTLLLFLLLLELGGGSLWLVGFTALIWWGIHPMHVEPVAWISARKDLMYVLFYFAGMLAYLRYRPAKGAPNYYWLAATLLFFILALLSKAMAVTFPVALLLIDFLKGRKPDWKMAVEKLPFFVLSLIFGRLAMHAQQSSGFVQTQAYNTGYSYAERIMFSCYAVVQYTLKMLLPSGFSALHPYPEKISGSYSMLVYISPVLILGIILLLIWCFYRYKKMAFGISFFLLGLLLILQFPLSVGRSIIAERYTYLSYGGLCYILVIGLNRGWNKYNGQAAKAITVATMAAYFAWFAYATYQRCMVWHDSKTLWSDIRERYPNNEIAPTQLGTTFALEGQDDSAAIYLKEAIGLSRNNPASNPWAYYYMGLIDDKQGKHDEAIKDYSVVITASLAEHDTTVLYTAYANRGMAYFHLFKADSAIRDFNAALSYGYPDPTHIFEFRGAAYLMKDDADMALQNLNRCLGSPLPVLDMYYINVNIATAYVKKQMPDSAILVYTRAIALNPALPDGYVNRGITYYQQKNLASAKTDFLKARQLGANLNPAYAALLK